MRITLKNLHEATEQEVFDHVARHLLTQGVKSGVIDHDGDFACSYRSDQGACAAGCLIADDEYTRDMDYGMSGMGNSWSTLVAKSVVPKAHASLVQSLQRVHDCFPVDGWENMLRSVAYDYSLSSEVVDTVLEEIRHAGTTD